MGLSRVRERERERERKRESQSEGFKEAKNERTESRKTDDGLIRCKKKMNSKQ